MTWFELTGHIVNWPTRFMASGHSCRKLTQKIIPGWRWWLLKAVDKRKLLWFYASSRIPRTTRSRRQFGPWFRYSYIMYLKHSCDHCLTNYIVTENLNDSQRYNKGIKGRCQLLFFSWYFWGYDFSPYSITGGDRKGRTKPNLSSGEPARVAD